MGRWKRGKKANQSERDTVHRVLDDVDTEYAG